MASRYQAEAYDAGQGADLQTPLARIVRGDLPRIQRHPAARHRGRRFNGPSVPKLGRQGSSKEAQMCFNPICDQRHHADKTERQQELSSAGIAQRHEGDETPCSTRLACVPLVLLSVFTFAACSDQSRPMLAPGGISGQLSQGGPQPFYYYQGQPIYLQIDSTRVVVETTEPSALAAAQSVLAPLGVATQDDGIIGQSTSHHRILRLAGATAQAAQRALQLLRADGRFTFASHIYNTLEGGHLMMPLNRLAVRFRPGVTVQQVDSINKVLGTRTISPRVPDSGYLSWR